jgi:hypothetical protein
MKLEYTTIIVLGLALLASGLVGKQHEDALREEVDAWRVLYERADSDAKFVNCLEVDNNYVICEKPTHGQDR